jgi:class 3 adenylate cyclase/TolB-like protein/tetratricopeptide (TPR) repeat protein
MTRLERGFGDVRISGGGAGAAINKGLATAGEEAPSWFWRQGRSVLLVDVVDSVRLIEVNEQDVIARWLAIVDYVRQQILPRQGGRIVRPTGDGMLMEFESVTGALNTAFAIQEFSARQNRGLAPGAALYLRMGIETGDLMVGTDDIFGRSVNLAARLSTLAGPGEIVISAKVRDQLTPDLHADVEDLGECFLRGVPRPVRAYRVGPPGQMGLLRHVSVEQLLPTVAVIPFASSDHQGPDPIGQIFAEEVIRGLSQTPHMNVISRLSTSGFQGAQMTAREIGEKLGANHVLTGVVRLISGRIFLSLELTEVRSQQVLWAELIQGQMDTILTGGQEMVHQVTEAVARSIVTHELKRARSQPIPTLDSYTLMLGAVAGMYRLSKSDFDYSREMLNAVIDRNPRAPVPRAWLGNWHVLRVQQGWSDDPQAERRSAEAATGRALDLDPDCAEALAIDGFVKTNLVRDLEQGEEQYDRALQNNPNNSLAWLLKGAMHSFRGDGGPAVSCADKALALSPLDPQKYFYNCLAAGSYLADGQHEKALELIRASLRHNRTHTSSLRVQAVIQWRMGDVVEARQTVQRLMELEPNFSVSRWRRTNPAGKYPYGDEVAEVLLKAGAPD